MERRRGGVRGDKESIGEERRWEERRGKERGRRRGEGAVGQDGCRSLSYLLWALETDPTLWRALAASGAGQRHGVKTQLQFGVFILKSEAPGSRIAAVVLLLIIPRMAVDKGRPAAAAHP